MVRIMSQNRIVLFDVAKAFAIILVVIGHSSTNIRIVNFIYLFHVPLFYFISGYFYKDEYSKNTFDFFCKKIKHLYIPFIKYEFIFMLLHNTLLDLHIYDISTIPYYNLPDYLPRIAQILTFRQTELIAYPFWFIGSLFIVNIIFVLISKITDIFKAREVFRSLFVLFIVFIGFITVDNHLIYKNNLNASLICLSFYYFGYMVKNNIEKIRFNNFLLIIALAILIVSSNYRIDVSTEKYITPIFFMINSLCGINFILFISHKISQYNFKVLNYIGKNTMIIMALQYLGFAIGKICTSQYSVTLFSCSWIIISACGLFIPLLINYILNTCNIDTASLTFRNDKI